MADSASITIDGVTHWFVHSSLTEMRPVLRDIVLHVAPGEFLCLVGPSGCGKTTLLNLIAGVIRPAMGSVEVTVNHVPQQLPFKGLGYMLARDTLLPWRSAVENVELGLELRRIGKPTRRAEATAALEMVGLQRAQQLYPSELSQGMRQRVNLARMLVTRPVLLLMDEPFGALDAQTRTHMQDEFLQIWQRNSNTVVFVTHDLNEAVLLADRVITMVEGSIVKETRVPFQRPRMPDQLRYDADFQQLVRELWNEIGTHTTSSIAR